MKQAPQYLNNYKNNVELREYADGVWDYIVEHCDITDSGRFFVKFHTHGRAQFERRIFSRINGYHRDNVEEKVESAEVTKEQHALDKLKRKKRYEWNKKKGRMILFVRNIIKKLRHK